MTLEEIISSLESQASDKDALVSVGEADSTLAHDAMVLRAAVRHLKRQPNICTVLGVRLEQEFIWRGYQLKVSGENGTVCKKTASNGWYGLEGAVVCELINNPQDIMRYCLPNVPLTLEELWGMDGEPVWVTSYLNDSPGWFLVNTASGVLEAGQRVIQLSDFQADWPYRAYRRKPEKAETTQK